MRLLMGGGFGDFLMVEAFWTPEQRRDLETIVWKARPRALFEPAFRANPAYRHVEHLDEGETHVTIFHLEMILHRLPYRGSTFLAMRSPSVKRFNLPRQYAVVQPSTPISRQEVRDMTTAEWRPLLGLLDAWGLPGVVLNGANADPVPDDPRLIDLTGKTSLLESISILKGSSGYVGIDSWQAILAAKLLPSDRLAIRTVNPHLVRLAKVAYAPQHRIDFLYPSFGAPALPEFVPTPIDNPMLITLKREMLVGTRNHFAGDVVEVNDFRGKELVRLGHAEPYTLPTPPVLENTTSRKVRKRETATNR